MAQILKLDFLGSQLLKALLNSWTMWNTTIAQLLKEDDCPKK